MQPEAYGIARGKRRLVKGLRREELAAAAGVGLTWYTWLEQGRDINVSATSLGRIASGMRLSETDRAYLFWLAGLQHEPPSALSSELAPEIAKVLDGYHWPAAAMTPMFELLCANKMMHRIYGFDRSVGPFHRNQLWQTMMNPERQALLANYEEQARHFVALFRLSSAACVGQGDFELLIDALNAESPLFREVWSTRLSEPPVPRAVRLRHVDLGEAALHVVRFPLSIPHGGMVFFLTPEDEGTSAALTRLARELTGGA